jgi:hypothetical protein
MIFILLFLFGRRMKKLAFVWMTLVFALAVAGCSKVSDPSGITLDPETPSPSSIFPLTIEVMPADSAQWGTFCQSVLGQGWACVVDLAVVNDSNEPWGSSDFLTANLIAEDGSVSASSNAPDNSTLRPTFFETANPGSKWEWSIYFSVGEGKKFTSIEILDSLDTVVRKIPVCIGSTDELALGCGE